MTKSELYEAILKDRKQSIEKVKELIENTYDEIVDLYKVYDGLISKNPHLTYSLKKSCASKTAAVVVRRNKLKKELVILNG